MQTIELLAPARDYETAVAAIDAGADAVYMGGARFGARVAAGNTVDDIRRAAEYAHRFGARIHVTINTLLYDDELAEAERQAREAMAAGADALIVQDMALREMDLPAELHASTQTCNMTPEGVRFLEECGFARVILERGLSLEEIRAIRAATTVDLECFVHGAICVGHSGRCFLSRSMTPDRSGNRGACSQPCRLTYDLVDGAGRPVLTGKHLLSVRDLNLTHRLGDLLDAGVCSFKIEGRLKDANYVRNVVAWYRAALDRELALRPHLRRASAGRSVPDFVPDPSKSFTRGESEFLFDGRRAGLASFDTPKAVGEPIGRVVRVDRTGFVLDRDHTLTAGDGICFGASGTSVNRVEGRRVVPDRMEGIRPGTMVSRNFDRLFVRSLERSRMRRVIPVRAEVAFSAGEVAVRFVDCEGAEAAAVRSGCFEPALQPQRMIETCRSQLSRSGDTDFAVEEVTASGEVRFVPVSLLAEMRREGLERLARVRREMPRGHRILSDDGRARFPRRELTAEENVTNRLAERFYRRHGVERIERGLDLERSTVGRRVLRSGYCIRREIGQCLKKNPSSGGALFLVHGAFRYRLAFDCARCEMSLIDESKE